MDPNESSNSNPTQQPVNESSDSNPTQPPVKPDDSHSGDNAPNPKQDDLPPSNLPSSDNFASVAIVPEKQPEVPPAPEQPSQTAASTPSQGPSAISGGSAITAPEASNPYVTAAPVRESSTKSEFASECNSYLLSFQNFNTNPWHFCWQIQWTRLGFCLGDGRRRLLTQQRRGKNMLEICGNTVSFRVSSPF